MGFEDRLTRMSDRYYAKKEFNPYFNDAASNVNGIVASGAAALQFGVEMNDEITRYRDMEFKNAQTMIGGIPSYSGVANLQNQYNAINVDDAGSGLIMKGLGKGAALGASIGSAVPGIGTAFGAAGGAIAGLATGIFGKQRAKHNAEDAQLRAKSVVTEGQENYNQDVSTYFNGVDSNRQNIQSERNYQNRMYGTNIRDPFASIV